jgi:hypothetical protein
MYYIIYETTNLVNNKKYRGAHATETIEDGYLGSGRDLRMAIRKYGREQFTRTIIYMAFDYDAMWHAESLLVDQEWVDRKDTYNISLGGRGSKIYGRKMSEEAKSRLSAKLREIKGTPEARKRNVEAQLKRGPTKDTTKVKMSLASKGKSKSKQHAQNISIGRKKLLADPVIRNKFRMQITMSHSRQEVRDKIRRALTGQKRSEETKKKCSVAAKTRCADPGYLAKQSYSQSKRWEENPATWWNNGEKSCRSVECPGAEWVPGRLSPGTWWNNGSSSQMSKDCPGPEWIPGRRISNQSLQGPQGIVD